MSLISTVRSVVQDKPVYASEPYNLAAGTLSLKTRHNPVIVGSVTVTSSGSVPAFTVDAETGAITFAIATGAIDVVVAYSFVLLSDQTIQDLIDLNGGATEANIRLVAADALDSIASNQTIIQKKIKLLDLSTDGPSVADSLRKHAKTLRDLVYSQDFVEPGIDFADQLQFEDSPAFNEFILKDLWRNEV